MHKVIATPDQEQHVRQSVDWNRKWDQSLGGLYYNEELAGPDGMSVQLFATEDTPDPILQAAEQQAYEEGDVVSIHALIVPAEWLDAGESKAWPYAQTGPLATLMEIVEQHTAKPLRWQGGEQQTVDVTTANMLLTMLNAIDAETRKKTTTLINRSRLDFLKVVDIGWSCVA